MPICTLLTDFGSRDYYVGAVKGTLLRLAPKVTLVDISHAVEPGDIVEAAFVLGAAAPAFPDGTVHLAVVDPGVGSARRVLAARAGSAFFVAPDNGLLTSILPRALVVSAERHDLTVAGPGHTFDGRDRFAPVAAALLRGEPIEALGEVVLDPILLTLRRPERSSTSLTGDVVHIDRFGNAVTNIPSAWLSATPGRSTVGSLAVGHYATHYAELEPGTPAILPGSLGTLEIALRDSNLAAEKGLRRGDTVHIEL